MQASTDLSKTTVNIDNSRLWRIFMQARLAAACILVLAQSVVWFNQTGHASKLPLLLAVVYLGLTASTLVFARPNPSDTWRWLGTIGVDVLVFALMPWLQAAPFNYTPLFALPVLLGAVMGSMTVGLGTAAAITLWLLFEGLMRGMAGDDWTSAQTLQAALTGTGFFLIAGVSHQLATRLAKEVHTAESNRRLAQTQKQISQMVMQDMQEGVLVVDNQCRIHLANPAALSLLFADTSGQATPSDIGHLPGAQALVQWVGRCFQSQQNQEADIQWQAGTAQPIRLAMRCRLSDGHSQANASTSTHVNASAKKSNPSSDASLCVVFLKDDREIESQVRNEKLVALGRMSAAVAHEIRNPLSAIAQANALLGEDLRNSAHQRLTQIVDTNAQRLESIVKDILNLPEAVTPKSESVDAPPLDLDEHLLRVCTEWTDQHQEHRRLAVHLGLPGVRVRFEPDHLRQLLVNLLDNARRYARPDAASIHVITQAHDAQHGRLSVWSDAPDITAQAQRHLFEPFFSSESRSSGLGLYICKQLCDQHQAQIGYQRSAMMDRAGNEFYVVFPLAPT